MIPTKEQIDNMGRREKRQTLSRLVFSCVGGECTECEHNTGGMCAGKEAIDYIVRKLTTGVGDDIELFGA